MQGVSSSALAYARQGGPQTHKQATPLHPVPEGVHDAETLTEPLCAETPGCVQGMSAVATDPRPGSEHRAGADVSPE